MPYVSAQYAPPLPPEMRAAQPKGVTEPRRVIATDDQGVEWHLTEDSQVGDWLRFIEAGGTVLAADPPTREGAKPAPEKKAPAKAKRAKKKETR